MEAVSLATLIIGFFAIIASQSASTVTTSAKAASTSLHTVVIVANLVVLAVFFGIVVHDRMRAAKEIVRKVKG